MSKKKNNIVDGDMPETEPTQTVEENGLALVDGAETGLVPTGPQNQYGQCYFCGQTTVVFIENKGETAEEMQKEANDYASERCGCTQGFEYRQKCDREKRRDEDMNRLHKELDAMGQYCDAHGLELKDSIRAQIIKAAEMVVGGDIELNVVRFNDALLTRSITAKVSLSSKGNIVLDFKYADGIKTNV